MEIWNPRQNSISPSPVSYEWNFLVLTFMIYRQLSISNWKVTVGQSPCQRPESRFGVKAGNLERFYLAILQHKKCVDILNDCLYSTVSTSTMHFKCSGPSLWMQIVKNLQLGREICKNNRPPRANIC